MDKKTKITLMLLCFPILITAQQQRTNSDNDNQETGKEEPEKQKIAWIHPGNGGNSQWWDFNRPFTVDDNKSYGESRYSEEWLTGREKETQHQYIMLGDSLICTGYENEMTTVSYSQPQVLLRFPVVYGQSAQTDFKGRGKFNEQLQLTLTGYIMTTVDSWGQLILTGGKILKDVFRVHITVWSFRQIDPLSSDFDINAPVDEKNDMTGNGSKNTSWIVEDVYRWYVTGSRHPVFETQETRVVSENDPLVIQRSAFIYNANDLSEGNDTVSEIIVKQ